MGNTFTQIHIQAVFAVKHRNALIDLSIKDPLEKYITGITQKCGHKMIAINSMPDHLHMFFGMRPNQSLSDLMQLVKGESSEWINKNRNKDFLFYWQNGYGAFSYDVSKLKTIADYVENQQAHHRHRTFLEEYREMLNDFNIIFDDRYLFVEPI